MDLLLSIELLLEHSLQRISTLDKFLVFACILILLVSKRITARFGAPDGESRRLKMLRSVAIAIILALIVYDILLPFESHFFLTRLLGVLLVIILGYIAGTVCNGMILRRFGRHRESNGEVSFAETYYSRLLTLLSASLIFCLVLVAIIQILGFEELLHAGGVFGVVGLILALSQSSWAPDLVSGLIILNSRLLQDDDVIEIQDGEVHAYLVFRTKMFHTELIDLSRNIRVMIQNSRLRGMTVRNLSKFASGAGLRERLSYNIAYGTPEQTVRKLFDTVFAHLEQERCVTIEFQRGFEIVPEVAADYAVRWTLFYYLKEVRQVVATRNAINAEVIRCAAEMGVNLATPVLLSATPALFGNGPKGLDQVLQRSGPAVTE